MTTRILFLCTGNSARSQMAEALARQLAVPDVEVVSAGTEPTTVNPLAVAAMRDRGIDISAQRSKGLEQVPGEFDYVITLCDDAARVCPVAPARRARLHWPLRDPAAAVGDTAERQAVFYQVRDEMEARLRRWLAEMNLLRETK